MRILATNDDGIHAEGLRVLVEELRKEHEVCVFAPDRERSGVSHAMSLKAPGKVRRHGEGEYSCSGTPADCVILAGVGAIPFTPDLVVSGINRGPNLGTDIVYSGTCGAARQASFQGWPAVAVSCASFQEVLLYRGVASFVRRHLPALLRSWSPGSFVNINAPSSDSESLRGRWTVPSLRRYRDKLRSFEAPDGYRYCFLSDTDIETVFEAESDHAAVSAGMVAISSILGFPKAAPASPIGEEWH